MSCSSPFFLAQVGFTWVCFVSFLIDDCWNRKACPEDRLLEDIPLLVMYESCTKSLESKHREHLQVSISVFRW